MPLITLRSPPPTAVGRIKVGYSDESDTDDSDDTTDSIDITEIKPLNVKLFPATVAGLCGRFNELVCKVIHDKRREHRNELVFLLDELKLQKGVSRKKYTRLNNSLSESLDDAADGEEEIGEDDVNEKEIVVDDDDSTLDYLTQPDKKELTELCVNVSTRELGYVIERTY